MRVLSLLFILFQTFSFAQNFEGGNGSENDPYQIENWYQLNEVRNHLSAYFILNENLSSETAGYQDLASNTANTNLGWEPIGSEEKPFQGHFMGNNKNIENLNIVRVNTTNIGLFGFVNNASISDLNLINAHVFGNNNTGSLVGLSRNSTIHAVHVESTNLIGYNNTGGLIGFQRGELGSTILCNVSGNITGELAVGGLVGRNYNKISKSRARNASVHGTKSVGGLVGINYRETNYDILLLTEGEGNINLIPDQASYSVGSEVTLTANPATGKEFDIWSGDIEGNTNPTTLTIDSDYTIKAAFSIATYTVFLDASPGTGGTNQITVTYGEPMPNAEAPSPDEQLGVFLGYYTQENGEGEQYYDENMDSVQNWNLTSNTTLYAFWVNFCEEGPCQNGGTCTNDQENLTFKCECPELYTGTRCEFLDACVVYANANNGNSPCANGDCVSDDGGIRCECNQGSACACCDGFDFPGFPCAAQGKEPTGSFCRDPSEITEMALLDNNKTFKNYSRFAEVRNQLEVDNLSVYKKCTN